VSRLVCAALAFGGTLLWPLDTLAATPAVRARIEVEAGGDIVIALEPGEPQYALTRLSQQRFILWLRGARPEDGDRRGQGPDAAWRLTRMKRGEATCRLDLSLASPGEPTVAYDRETQALVVAIGPGTATPAGQPRTLLGPASYDMARDALVMPYYGQTPRLTELPGPAPAVGIADSAVAPGDLQYGVPAGHPLVARWHLAPTAGNAAQIALTCRHPARLRTSVDRQHHVVLIGPELTAEPAAEPLPVPGLVSGKPGRWQAPMRALAPFPASGVAIGTQPWPGAAAPTPAPPAAPVGAPIRSLWLEAGADLLTERLAAGDLDVGPAWVPRVGLVGRYDINEEASLLARVRYRQYTLVDTVAPDSRHHRDDFELQAGGAYRPAWGPAFPWLEAGYHVQQVFVANSVAPSLQQPLLFSPNLLYHGPHLGTRWEGRAERWQASLGLGAWPVVWAVGDAAVATLSPLFGYGARPALVYQATSWLDVALGYRAAFLTGYSNDYWRLEHGPSLSLQGRF
jgi:hypothetical protein